MGKIVRKKVKEVTKGLLINVKFFSFNLEGDKKQSEGYEQVNMT